jgi:hypothetical protein
MLRESVALHIKIVQSKYQLEHRFRFHQQRCLLLDSLQLGRFGDG